MAEPAGALTDIEVAVLAEIIPPWIRVVCSGRFVRDQGLAAHPATIGADTVQLSGAGASRRIAVPPIHEGLGIGEGRCLGNRETDPGIDGVVRHAAFAPEAGAWNDVAGAVKGDDGGLFGRPIDRGGVDRIRLLLRRGARDAAWF